MKTPIILIPGAWMGDWVWNPLKYSLEGQGYDVHALTLSGLSKGPEESSITLEIHVSDVLNYLDERTLKDVILVGHSYSGFVAGIAANRHPKRIPYVICIEAFLPSNGKSLLDVTGLDSATERAVIEANGGRWPHPTREEVGQQPGVTEEVQAWFLENFVGHPGRTITDKAQMTDTLIKGAFVGATLPNRDVNDVPRYELEFAPLSAGHWPMVTSPEALTVLIDRLIKGFEKR